MPARGGGSRFASACAAKFRPQLIQLVSIRAFATGAGRRFVFFSFLSLSRPRTETESAMLISSRNVLRMEERTVGRTFDIEQPLPYVGHADCASAKARLGQGPPGSSERNRVGPRCSNATSHSSPGRVFVRSGRGACCTEATATLRRCSNTAMKEPPSPCQLTYWQIGTHKGWEGHSPADQVTALARHESQGMQVAGLQLCRQNCNPGDLGSILLSRR